MDAEQIKSHRVADPEIEFLNRYPDAREGAVYEFDTEAEADAARAVLTATAFVAAQRGRVMRVAWKNRQRVMAVAHV